MEETENFDPSKFQHRPLFTRTWVWVIVSLVIVGLVGVFSINRIMNALLHSRPEVVVPKLVGKTLNDALEIVSKSNLSIQQEETSFDDSLPAGTIVRQHPPSGMQVRSGRAIRVVVSKGGEVVFIPEIIGKQISEAQSLLGSQGLQMGAVSEIYSSDFSKNAVVSQNPSATTVVTKGALVDIEISKGMPPSGLPLLPDFTGQSLEKVREWVTGVNSKVRVKEDAKAIGSPGAVIKQEPLPGQPLLEDQDVLVTIVSASAIVGKRITYRVPPDLGDVTIRIVKRDSDGESVVYEQNHPSNAVIEFPVNVQAATRFRIYVDDTLKDEQVIEP